MCRGTCTGPVVEFAWSDLVSFQSCQTPNSNRIRQVLQCLRVFVLLPESRQAIQGLAALAREPSRPNLAPGPTSTSTTPPPNHPHPSRRTPRDLTRRPIAVARPNHLPLDTHQLASCNRKPSPPVTMSTSVGVNVRIHLFRSTGARFGGVPGPRRALQMRNKC